MDPHNDQLPVGQITQLVEHCTRIVEVRARIPFMPFSLLLKQCKTLQGLYTFFHWTYAPINVKPRGGGAPRAPRKCQIPIPWYHFLPKTGCSYVKFPTPGQNPNVKIPTQGKACRVNFLWVAPPPPTLGLNIDRCIIIMNNCYGIPLIIMVIISEKTNE